MSVSFDLLLGFLEEDDVQHAYFRVHPLLTPQGPVTEDAVSQWPENGCLRIVPDRMEQHSFKSRMRTLGHFCMVDLRQVQPGLDKIRPNKNYHPERGETNQFILYSDTVRPVLEEPFFEILDGTPDQASMMAEAAVTPLFYLRHEGALYGPIRRDASATPEAPAEEVEGTQYEFPCPDAKFRRFLCIPQPEVVQPAEEPQAEAAPVAVPEAPVSPEANLLRGEPAPSQPEQPEQPEQAAQPNLNGTPLYQSPYRTATPQPKNRLQEVVHSQWRVVKDHPPAAELPEGTEMKQVENPVEAATSALEEAWKYPRAREQLVNAMLSLDGMESTLDHVLRRPLGESPLQRTVRAKLNDLEAERLGILVQLDQARSDLDQFRKETIANATAASKAELTGMEAQKTTMQADIDTLAQQITLLTAQRDELARRVEELQGQQLPEALAKALADARMVSPVDGPVLHLSPVSGQALEASAVVNRFQSALKEAGWETSQNTAAAIITMIALCRRFGLVTSAPAVTTTLLRNTVRQMGWQTGFALQSTLEEKPLVSFLPANATPVLLATLLPSYAPQADTTKIFFAHMAVQMTRTTPYSADQWPILMLPNLPYLPENDAVGSPVALTAVKALLDDADLFRTDQVLADVLSTVPPMSGLAVREMNRFVTVAAKLMEGGLPAACDWAISLWLVPQVMQSARLSADLLTHMTEYPVSQKLLEARLSQQSEAPRA